MDNAVGSLTQNQRSIIVGTLLGDGYLRKIKGRKDAFLEVNHSFKQKEYVDWKHVMLKEIVVSGPKKRRGNGNRIAYRFYTKQLPELSTIMGMFYCGRSKIIPDITLNPIMLAVWFMDDGSKCREADVYLNTQQFSVADQCKLIRMLKNVGLDARLNRDKEYWRIRFLKSSIPTLNHIISPHIISSMRYKIGL
jgi:hypothetical protein